MLKYPNRWRISPPADGEWINETIPSEARESFLGWINRVAQHRVEFASEKHTIEKYKEAFSAALGVEHYSSSNLSWARTDLRSLMDDAVDNPPLFLEAFWDGCQTLKSIDESRGADTFYIPDDELINEICRENNLGYRIAPPSLVLRNEAASIIEASKEPDSLDHNAKEVVTESLGRAEELLSEGRGREAVQETLWLLESVSTVFKGKSVEGQEVQGKYFNDILKDLYRSKEGTTFSQVVGWVQNIHGYLSSPTGGGVRHGLDLEEGTELGQNEARLFTNLIRSYTLYFLDEHRKLEDEQA
jgi:hypothetical protein